ncbi:MAG TPA: HDOD domain-containing protein [Rhodocyclaceae bacterium]
MGLKDLGRVLASLWSKEPPPAPEPAPATPVPEFKIGRFPVLRMLGRGAQGSVYLARDPDLDRLVAIKRVDAVAGAGESGWPQARNLAQLRHPNIVALHEFGRDGERMYLVFEYIEGTTLAEELKSRGRLPAADAATAMLQITAAIGHAHAHGILHLDLNPRNVMRDGEGVLRVMDFDVSRRADATPPGDLIVGTVRYMAPEHFTTRRLDQRTDVYALGQMFYTLLAGTPAMAAKSAAEAADIICNGQTDLAPLKPLDPQGQLIPIIRRATAKDPALRFPDARAMHDALAAALAPAPRAQTGAQGAVAFLLKRMERRGEFPAVSRTLAEINRIAGDEKTTLARISSAVLRDYALTNRLLKIANSAYYPHLAGKVATVSDAIKMLGFNEVRLICSGLACFGHLAGGRQKRLREESTGSFIAGLIARHLAVRAGIKDVEEAFIAAMLLDLGKALALYYFPEDYWEIENMVTRGATPDEAARKVLGLTLRELGHAIGQVWSLPPAVLDCMLDGTAGEGPPGIEELRAIVRFANALAAADGRDPGNERLAADAARLHPPLPAAEVDALLQAALDKFRAFAPVLEIEPDKSARVQQLTQWLAARATFRSSITP